METTTCNYCGSADAALLHTIPDLLLDRPEVITRLVRCRVCGLVYQNPRPTIAEMAAHYPPEYDSYDRDPDARKASPLMQRVVRYGTEKRIRAVTARVATGRLLDVGCATGNFLLGMQRQGGWTLTGVEISPHAAEIARGHGLAVVTGTLESAQFPDAAFDAVTLWDVFEHLHDPAGTLAEIHRVLAPGGVLVLRVPNMDSWEAGLFGSHWAGLDAPRHTYVFNRGILRKLLSRAGFTRIEMKSNIGGYPTFVLSVRFWMTARGTPPARRARIERLLLHPIARLLAAPFFFLASLGVRGSQVVVSTVKPGTG